MEMTGPLLSPDIDFDIDILNSDQTLFNILIYLDKLISITIVYGIITT